MASGTMTSREAIDILRVINPPRENKRIFDEFIQARNMAIKALEKLAAIKSRTSPFDDWEYYADRLYDIAYQNGCEQGKKYAEQDRWIPCSVKPPKNKKKVLVSYDTEDGKKVDISMFDKYGCLLGLVSAWRPLPEPYTEEEA